MVLCSFNCCFILFTHFMPKLSEIKSFLTFTQFMSKSFNDISLETVIIGFRHFYSFCQKRFPDTSGRSVKKTSGSEWSIWCVRLTHCVRMLQAFNKSRYCKELRIYTTRSGTPLLSHRTNQNLIGLPPKQGKNRVIYHFWGWKQGVNYHFSYITH